jgi:hypothetical protein
MTVYVDDWRQRARLGHVDAQWSHLIADSDEELHRFAARLGMKEAWFQTDPRRPHRSHYDVTEALRRQAISLGAVAITWRDIGRMMRERREQALGAGEPRPSAGP